jgi:RNA polymerase sigma-70 factor (ECF subfamily)
MPGGDETDLQLIARINAGYAAAFDVLYYRYRDWVVRLARRFTGNDADALDVMQETFVYLYRKFPGFTLTARMTTFLWPVVRNSSLQARRRREMSLAIDEATLDLPGKPQAGTEDDLATALDVLSHEHRQVVLMRVVDELSTEDVAALLGVPPGTVKSRLHHAIGQLRQSPSVRRYFEQDK